MDAWFINGKQKVCITFKINELKYILDSLSNEISARKENGEQDCYTTNELFNLINDKLQQLETKKI